MDSTEPILSEIESRLGHLPPLLRPALETPALLAGLAAQLKGAWLDNPLPQPFTERVLACLARYSAAPYSLGWHCCRLYSRGVSGDELLDLLLLPELTPGGDLAPVLEALALFSVPLPAFPAPGERLFEHLLQLTLHLFRHPADPGGARPALRRLLSPSHYAGLISLLSFAAACRTWLEAHPGLTLAAPPGFREALDQLFLEVPALAPLLAEPTRIVQEIQAGTRDGRVARGEKSRKPNGTHERELRRALQSAMGELRQSETRLRFIAEASAVLASSLDFATTLSNLAKLAVPRLADWCVIDVVEADQRVRRLVIAHADPVKVQQAWDLERYSPVTLDRRRGPGRVMRTGEPEFIPAMTPEVLEAIAADASELGGLATLGLKAVACVPMRIRDRTVGAITLATAESGRTYAASDLLIMQDLAGRAALAVDNARLFKEAQKAVQAREEFLSVASHELKAPVTTLSLHAQFILRLLSRGQGDSLSPERLQSTLKAIVAQSDRLVELLNLLLDISRLAAHHVDLRPEALNLAELVRDLVARSAEQLHRASCPLTIEATGDLSGGFDRLRVEQIMTNLLSNAMKYGAGHPIEVRLEGLEQFVRLQVRDHGIGIAPEEQARIFERFERAGNVGRQSGFGLGLWIVRQLVEAMGGSIQVESVLDAGATFTVELPRTPRPKPDGG